MTWDEVGVPLAKIERALGEFGGGTHNLQDMLSCIEKGEAQLWCAPGAVIVTQIEENPHSRDLRFWVAAGTLQAVLDLAPQIYRWAREEHGCTRAVTAGRKGWSRALAQLGWRPTLVLYERPLTDGQELQAEDDDLG